MDGPHEGRGGGLAGRYSTKALNRKMDPGTRGAIYSTRGATNVCITMGTGSPSPKNAGRLSSTTNDDGDATDDGDGI